jgi:hypothetical protein
MTLRAVVQLSAGALRRPGAPGPQDRDRRTALHALRPGALPRPAPWRTARAPLGRHRLRGRGARGRSESSAGRRKAPARVAENRGLLTNGSAAGNLPAAKSTARSSASSPRITRRTLRCPGRAWTSTSRAPYLTAGTLYSPSSPAAESVSGTPVFPWTDTPPAGVKLPKKEDQTKVQQPRRGDE